MSTFKSEIDEIRPEGMFTTSEDDDGEEEEIDMEEEEEYKTKDVVKEENRLAQTAEGRKMLDRVINSAVERIKLRMNEVILQCKVELKQEKMKYKEFELNVETERGEMREMRKRNETLRNDLRKREEEIEALKESLRASMEERRILRQNSEEICEKMSDLEKSEADLHRRLKTSYFDTERLHIQVKTLQEMKEYLSKEWQNAEEKLKSYQEKVKIAESERDGLVLKLRESKLFKEYLENKCIQNETDQGIAIVVKTKLQGLIREAETYQLRSPKIGDRPFGI